MTMTATLPSPGVVDRSAWPDELRLLLGADAGELLAAAAGAAGAELAGWSARQVTHDPARSTVVQYRAELAWPDGSRTAETVVAAAGTSLPSGAAVLRNGDAEVAVWRWPADPSLPGLATAVDGDRVARLLDEVGVGGSGSRLRVRAYRPGRRAVVEATGRRGRLFLKVVRPSVVEGLHRTHRHLAASAPVPDSLGWTDDGVLVLPGLPGRPLRDVLRSGGGPVPSPAAVEAVLDRLPADLAADGRRRRSPLDTVGHHAGVIASVQPELRPRLDGLLAELAARDVDDHEVVPVHGDLYEAQLLVAGTRITGLLDVDTAGAGHRVDDLANLVAHLSVMTQVDPRSKALARFGAAVLERAEARYRRDDVRARVAAAVVGLATGPFRVLERRWPAETARRLDLAARWLDG